MHIILYILFSINVVLSGNPKVVTPAGTVSGYLKTSYHRKVYSAFEGIPYAKPPTGDLRFKAPEPSDPWLGTWNATTLHECVQITKSTKIIGFENCLYINIYVPKKQPHYQDDIDVIAHIHGGSFLAGSPHSYTRPDFLIDENVIFVSFTYRLGVLGFLSTGDNIVPGNNGLKDQILALKWIQNNIKYFGGNPKSVTLSGFSAGAACSHFLYLSPLSKGLFSRGISHSGTAISPWAIQHQPIKTTQSLSKLIGCPIETNEEMIKCLRERPANHILSKARELSPALITTLFFGPVIDDDVLPKNPVNILKEGNLPNIPWLFSVAAQDGLYPAILFLNNLEDLDEQWNYLAPSMLKYHLTHPQSEWNNKAKDIKQHYLGDNQKINDQNYGNLLRLLTDRYFLVDGEKSARLQSKSSNSSVYFYYYNYMGNTTFTDITRPDLDDEYKAIGHGDDILHLYGNVVSYDNISDTDKKVIKLLVKMLVTFARTGKPQINGLDWKPTSFDKITYLNITSPTKLSMNVRKSISDVEFWDEFNIHSDKLYFENDL